MDELENGGGEDSGREIWERTAFIDNICRNDEHVGCSCVTMLTLLLLFGVLFCSVGCATVLFVSCCITMLV
jgi:hypothetical protein